MVKNKQYNNITIEQSILQTLRYFFFFNYPPTFTEIHTFLKKKTSKRRLASILEKMTKENLIIQSNYFLSSSRRRSGSRYYIDSRFHGNDNNEARYTLGEYSKQVKSEKLKIKNWIVRKRYSRKKIQKIQLFLKILSFFPQIKLVGLSGTVAMMNAEEKDDIDLFIITARKKLFTGRLIALLLAQLMGLRRKRRVPVIPAKAGIQKSINWIPDQVWDDNCKNKLCLNLFFDEANLKVPKYKQTEYVAHEVLQMKPLINKHFTYERFLEKNNWVYTIFPNAKKLKNQKELRYDSNFLGNLLEFFLKKLQLISIKLHQTNEIVTNTQLWFFPEDFEKKLYGLSRD